MFLSTKHLLKVRCQNIDICSKKIIENMFVRQFSSPEPALINNETFKSIRVASSEN